MNILLTNAFSINMLEKSGNLSFSRVENPAELVLSNCLVGNAIGHTDIDRVARGILAADGVVDILEGRRDSVVFGQGHDALLVAQYRGPRLPEGATMLPKNATVEWWLVKEGK